MQFSIGPLLYRPCKPELRLIARRLPFSEAPAQVDERKLSENCCQAKRREPTKYSRYGIAELLPFAGTKFCWHLASLGSVGTATSFILREKGRTYRRRVLVLGHLTFDMSGSHRQAA